MKKLVTLVSLIIVTVVSAQEESTLLKLNYNEGDKYVMEINSKQSMNGHVIIASIAEMPIEVTSVNDGIYNSEMGVKRIKSNMNQPGMNVNYDSEIKEENLNVAYKAISDEMNPMLETVLATKTNVYGEVLEKEIIKGSASLDVFTRQVESIIYPKEAVTVGYSWKTEKENSKGVKIDRIYTVKSITANEVIVNVTDSSNRISGVINIDKTSGVQTASHINIDFKYMDQNMKSEVVIKMKKVG